MSTIKGVVGGGNLKNQLKIDAGITAPAVVNATGGLVAIDRQGYNAVLFSLAGGAVVSSGSVTPKLQHSDTTTDGDFSDVTAALQGDGDLTATALDTSGQLRQIYADCVQLKRYVRIYLTLTGTSIIISCAAVKGAAEQLPAA